MVLAQTNLGTLDLYGIDGDLPSLACQAAIELDKLIQGRSINEQVVRTLSTRIAQMIDAPHSGNLPFLPDTTAVVLIKRAIDDACIGMTPISTVAELVQQAQAISQNLESLLDGDRPEREALQKMRAFCIALSKNASAYAQQFDENWQPNSFGM